MHDDDQPDSDDFGIWHDLYEAERKALDFKGRPLGICLSGGGVRSAVTSMGVLGCLQKHDLLSKFHYLSTVSGGGFAGGAWSVWYRQIAKDPGTAENGPGLDSLYENHAYLRHLQANINYIMPNGVGDFIKASFVFARTMTLTLFVWLTVTAALFWAVMLVGKNDHPGCAFINYSATNDLSHCVSKAATFLPELWFRDWLEGSWQNMESAARLDGWSTNIFGWLLAGGLCAAIALLALMIIFSVFTYIAGFAGFLRAAGVVSRTRSSPRSRGDFPRLRAVLSALTSRYRWRRGFERLAVIGAAIMLFGLVAGSLPWVAQNLVVLETVGQITSAIRQAGGADSFASVIFGMVSAMIGIGISLVAFARQRLGKFFGRKSAIGVVVGSLLLVYGITILAFNAALHVHMGSEATQEIALYLLGAAAFLGFICNINDISLARFYQDRLIETFMPDLSVIQGAGRDNNPLARISPPATCANSLRLTEFKPGDMPFKTLHLVNTNVMCWWADDTKAQRRFGDNFILSAIGSGSDLTGWRRTEDVENGQLRMATAIATSGAAANPKGGFVGRGVTTSVAVSLAMALLGIRLGYWLRWKPCRGLGHLNRKGNRFNPSALAFLAGVFRPLRRIFGDTPGFLELTDGGHFENLGLYELIRRRCKVILVCDCGEDRDASYASFTSAILRVREDFGVRIEFDMEWDEDAGNKNRTTMVDTGPQDLVPRPTDQDYPSGVEYARKGYFLASVTYPESRPASEKRDGTRVSAEGKEEKALLIYLKSALLPSIDLTTKGYRGTNPDFPYDPTSNQFFSPEQLEAYRDVGSKITEQMINDLHLNRIEGFGDNSEAVDKILNNVAFRKKRGFE